MAASDFFGVNRRRLVLHCNRGSVYNAVQRRKMDEALEVNKIEANLPQEKIDFINDAHAKEVDYWKRATLGRKNEDERKQLTDPAPVRDFLARKGAVNSGVESINEMLFYLRNNYSFHTEEKAFIEEIQRDDRFSFEEMADYLKTFSKSFIQVENMTLKNKVLLGG